MSTNLNFNADSKNNLASYITAGQVIFTEDNLYLVKSDGSKIKYSSIEVVPSLPVSQISSDKIYILSSNFSLNYYDGSWHLLGGNEQISIGTTAPTDTTKLFLDIIDKTKPILKWYDSTTTSWINISSTIDTSTLLDKITYKGSADGIVKKADTLAGLTSTPSQIDNIVNNGISPNIANRSNGKVVTYNSSTGEEEWADITITGVVGSSQITTISDTTIASGSEQTFNHPTSTNIVIGIEEQIAGSSVTDTHVDFSDSSKYTLQDSGKILFGSNKAQLDIYTKLLMHMDDSSFTDACGHTITNTGVTLNASVYKFGVGSSYFNGSSYFYTTTDNNFVFDGDFTIDFWMYPTSLSDLTNIFVNISSDGALESVFLMRYESSCLKVFLNNNDASAVVISSSGVISTNQWYHIALVRYNGTIKLYVNGISVGQTTNASSLGYASKKFGIGLKYSTNPRFIGYIDELKISKGIARWTNNFTPKTLAYGTPYLTTNTPTYLKTTGTSDYSLTTIDTITSLTIPVTLPSVNTTCKILTSFDNGVNYLYHDGTGWHKYTGDLMVVWTSSNLNTDLQTYFTNKSIADLTSDLSGLGIVPVSLDFAFQLNSQNTSETPSVSATTMVYINKAHNEFASYGNYSSSNVEFGVKRISNSSIGVKNLQSTSKTIKVNIVTSV